MIDSEAAYLARDRQLRAACAIAHGRAVVSDRDYVDWLIEVKRPQLKESSWRQYRCAAAYALEKVGGCEPLALASRLRATEPSAANVRSALPRRTSAMKSKRPPQADMDRLNAKILASRSPYRNQLCAYLKAATMTGLRPCEWPSVKLRLQDDTLIVTVTNAKANDLRAHSAERTLMFVRLSRKYVQPLSDWLDAVMRAGEDYPRLLKALGDALRWFTRRTFPQRSDWPTLYTPRHLFAANAKARYADDPAQLAIVAALLGHSSDATATKHYAKGAGGSFPAPNANSAEIGLVRALFADKFARFLARAKRDSAPPRTKSGTT